MKRDESPMNDSLEIFVRHIKRASFFAHEIQDFQSKFFIVPGLIGALLMQTTITAMAVSVVREREKGTLEALIVSPIRRWELLLGKIIPNLLVAYGQMTMALLAQTALHRLRGRLGEPFSAWDAGHLAKSLLAGLEGDVRVNDDTIVITYYNAPNVERLREHYADLPDRLQNEHVDPHIPWLYGYKLDFRFR